MESSVKRTQRDYTLAFKAMRIKATLNKPS